MDDLLTMVLGRSLDPGSSEEGQNKLDHELDPCSRLEPSIVGAALASTSCSLAFAFASVADLASFAVAFA